MARCFGSSKNEIDVKDKITMCGIVIVSRESDNYINATQLCQAGDKRFKKWYENDKSKAFVDELSRVARIRATDLIDIKQGGNDQGTWVHPRVAINNGYPQNLM
jgi:hypothetical protein